MDKVESDAHDTIINLCKVVQQRAMMVGLLGAPGCGKTFSLKFFAANFPNVIMITLCKGFKAKNLFVSILTQLNPTGDSFEVDPYELMNVLVNTINRSRSKLLIIVDECGKINPLVQSLHDLRDRTIGKAGIVLSGPPYFLTNINKAIAADRPGMAEFKRRVNDWPQIPNPTPSELKDFCKLHKVIDNEWIESVVEQCQSFGEMENKIINYQIEQKAHKNGFLKKA